MTPFVLLALFAVAADVKEPALREELLVRVKADQAARTKLIDAGNPTPPDRLKAVKEADARRKELGLMPMAEYVAFAEKMYELRPAIPIRQPEVEALVVKVVPAKETDEGVLATSFLKGRDAGGPITRTTAAHKQMGELVPDAEIADLEEGAKVRLWLTEGKAEAVRISP